MSDSFVLQKVIPGDARRFSDIKRVVEELQALEEGKAWRVSIENLKSERSLKQNRYLWGIAYKLLSERTGYESDDLHSYLLGKHFGTRLKKIPKSKYNREGLIEIPVRTTTTDEHGRRSVLGKMQFSEYVNFIQRFAANVGVVIPDPDASLAADEFREEAA